MLGDSITFGRGVEQDERFSDRLQATLGEGFEVINLGLSGATTGDLLTLLRRHIDLQPDLVVVQAPANDLDKALWRRAQHRRRGIWADLSASALAASPALQYLRFTRNGDDYDAIVEATSAAAGEYHGQHKQELLDLLRARGIPMVVVAVPFANGVIPGIHVVHTCAQNRDVCLGDAVVDMPTGDDGPTPPWIHETAELMGVDVQALRQALPRAPGFHDLVHPNAHGNLVIFQSLRHLLQQTWDHYPSSD